MLKSGPSTCISTYLFLGKIKEHQNGKLQNNKTEMILLSDFFWLKCFRQCPRTSGIRKMAISLCHCYEMNPFWFGQYDFSDLQHLPCWIPCQRVNINRAMVGTVVNKLDRYLTIITRFPSNMLTRGKCNVAEGIYLRRRFCKVACMFAIPLPWFVTLVSYTKKHDACQLTKYLLKYREIMLQDCGRL